MTTLTDKEFDDILQRNKSVSSGAILRAVQDASEGLNSHHLSLVIMFFLSVASFGDLLNTLRFCGHHKVYLESTKALYSVEFTSVTNLFSGHRKVVPSCCYIVNNMKCCWLVEEASDLMPA